MKEKVTKHRKSGDGNQSLRYADLGKVPGREESEPPSSTRKSTGRRMIFWRMPEPSRIHSVMTESCIRFTLNAVLSTDEAKSSMNLDCGGRLLPVSP